MDPKTPASTAPLSGRIALVTGAGRGLGGAIALDLAQAGARVAICDVDTEAMNETRARIQQETGARCLALPCDISVSADVAHMFEAVDSAFGALDILVNNAAVIPGRAQDALRRRAHYTYISTPEPRRSLRFTSQMSDQEWHRYWDVNVHGLFYCTRAALQRMEAKGYGRIVNVASVAGLSAMSAHSPHYSATKGAVIALTKSVAAEVAGANIFVNALAPGGIATREFNDYLELAGDEDARRLWQSVPAGRLGTMQEYASLVRYLAGDHYMVGQVLSPNGGAVI